MNESRVDEMLTSLHNFAYFHNGSIKKRDDVYMSFSTRNTIPWSLSCEIMDGKDRNFGLQQFSLSLEHEPTIEDSIKLTTAAGYGLAGFWAIGLACCGSCAVCMDRGSKSLGFAAVLAICQRGSLFIVACIVIHHLNQIKRVSFRNLDELDGMETADCSDEFSIIKLDQAIESQEETISLCRMGIAFLAIGLTYHLIEFTFVACVLLKCCQQLRRCDLNPCRDRYGHRRCRNIVSKQELISYFYHYKVFN